jgi:hypothetical protein
MLDMANRVVSIDLHVDEVGAGMLCYGHAERVVVPKGWTLEDQRVHEPRLFDVGRPENRLEPSLASETGRPYDHAQDDTNNESDDANEAGVPRRKERKRRKLLPTKDTGASESHPTPQPTPGQMAFNGYDLPSEYDSLPEEFDRDEAVDLQPIEDLDELLSDTSPDREANPLLARAFDVTRSRQTPAQFRTPAPRGK